MISLRQKREEIVLKIFELNVNGKKISFLFGFKVSDTRIAILFVIISEILETTILVATSHLLFVVDYSPIIYAILAIAAIFIAIDVEPVINKSIALQIPDSETQKLQIALKSLRKKLSIFSSRTLIEKFLLNQSYRKNLIHFSKNSRYNNWKNSDFSDVVTPIDKGLLFISCLFIQDHFLAFIIFPLLLYAAVYCEFTGIFTEAGGAMPKSVIRMNRVYYSGISVILVCLFMSVFYGDDFEFAPMLYMASLILLFSFAFTYISYRKNKTFINEWIESDRLF